MTSRPTNNTMWVNNGNPNTICILKKYRFCKTYYITGSLWIVIRLFEAVVSTWASSLTHSQCQAITINTTPVIGKPGGEALKRLDQEKQVARIVDHMALAVTLCPDLRSTVCINVYKCNSMYNYLEREREICTVTCWMIIWFHTVSQAVRNHLLVVPQPSLFWHPTNSR